MTKLYWVLGSLLLTGYLLVQSRGIVMMGTDRPPGAYAGISGGKRSPRGGGGFLFFGTGYRGGK